MAVEEIQSKEVPEAAEVESFDAGYTWTLLMRSAFAPAVAVIPGFPTREACEAAGRIAEGNPNIDEYGQTKDVEVVSQAGAWTRRWLDITCLPVPRG